MKFDVSFKEQEPFYLEAIKSLGVSPNNIKRVGDEDITCTCPICGDSKIGTKKRLHFYSKGEVINVNCFNGDCPVHNMTLFSFLKTYTPRHFNQFKEFIGRRYLIKISNSSKKAPKQELEGTMIGTMAQIGFDFEEKNENVMTPDKIPLLEFIKGFNKESPRADLIKIKEFLSEHPSQKILFKKLIQEP